MSASSLSNDHGANSTTSLGALRQFARKREPARPPAEHCELCSEIIPSDHRHLLNLSSRALVCTCQACLLLFSNPEAGSGKYRTVPQRYLSLSDFSITDEQWDELRIPVNMAFIFHSTSRSPNGSSLPTSPPLRDVKAFYPSPAGAMESLLDLEGWKTLTSSNPMLNELEPDVEALLINRVKNAREHYIVPIDACYQLVGRIRLSWKGLSGGQEVWEAIDKFFSDIRAKSQPMRGEPNAGPEL